jgi:spore germination protein YaaH
MLLIVMAMLVTSVAAVPALGGPATAAPAPRAGASPGGAPVTGWLPGWSLEPALQAVEANADLFDEISPFWYTARASAGTVDVTTALTPQARAASLARVRAKGIAIVPSVADGSAKGAMAAVLADPEARRVHVAQLVELVGSEGYDGIELDYEKFAFTDGTASWAATRPAWVAFISELGAALHALGKRLAVAVPPMYDGNESPASGYWVYDFAGMAPHVDSVRIMTYDYSVARPGPIAPLAFVRKSLAYAVTVLPPSRIRMGLPGYGRLWPARRADGKRAVKGTCPVGVPRVTSFTATDARAHLRAAAGKSPAVRHDGRAAESVASFTRKYRGRAADGSRAKCRVRHVAWWVDARGVAARAALAAEYGLAGVAVWHVGGLDPASWAVLRAGAGARRTAVESGAAAQGTESAAPAPALGAPTLKVRPSTKRPRKGSKVRVRVRLTPGTSSVVVRRQVRVDGRWRTVARERTNERGVAIFSHRWTGKPRNARFRVRTSKRAGLPAATSAPYRLRTR